MLARIKKTRSHPPILGGFLRAGLLNRLRMQVKKRSACSANQCIPTAMSKFTKAAAAGNLGQVSRPERLWENRGSRLPLRSVIRLWIEGQRT